MNRFIKASLIAAMLTAPVMADESFGGVGITIYQVKEGVHVAEVIPGTPAAETNLKAGDVITAVDGGSLEGQDILEVQTSWAGQQTARNHLYEQWRILLHSYPSCTDYGEGLGQQGCQELVR